MIDLIQVDSSGIPSKLIKSALNSIGEAAESLQSAQSSMNEYYSIPYVGTRCVFSQGSIDSIACQNVKLRIMEESLTDYIRILESAPAKYADVDNQYKKGILEQIDDGIHRFFDNQVSRIKGEVYSKIAFWTSLFSRKSKATGGETDIET